MNIKDRIESFSILGRFLSQFTSNLVIDDFSAHNEKYLQSFIQLIKSEYKHNAWFTEENVITSFKGITGMLVKEELEKWVENYKILSNSKTKIIGLVMAGNIPLVGFHDLLCVVISGHRCVCRLSSKDNRLLKALVDVLFDIDPQFKEFINIVEDKLTGFDAVIATGSNNTSRYFEYYFGKYPHIIRKNRNSIAILSGRETNEELQKLADDIFIYYGLGCRNVSKLLVPYNYNFDIFFKSIENYSHLTAHNKYMNNHDYNRSIYLVNQEPHLDNGFLLIREDMGLSSPIGVLYYHTYRDLNEIEIYVENNKDNIQCIAAVDDSYPFKTVPFGKTQFPQLTDYADDIDTMEFLNLCR